MKRFVKEPTALEIAFRKAVEEKTASKKSDIKSVMFGQKPGEQIAPRTIKPAPKAGNVPREEIQKAVAEVSKKDE